MKAYIVEGFLYGSDLPEHFEIVDAENGITYDKFTCIDVSAEQTVKKYAAYNGQQPCLIKPGKYTIKAEGVSSDILSAVSHRVPVHTTDNGALYPFDDAVFPIIYGNSDEVGFKLYPSSLADKDIPKILRDGNTEVFADGAERSYAYPKENNGLAAFIIENGEIPDDLEGKTPLKHGDILEISFDGKAVQRFIWDQISKIWYVKKDAEAYPFVKVKGGTYTMGDHRGKLYNYSFGMHNVNMKKNWEKIYDPQYMGETVSGEAAVGVEGLKDENSLAAKKDSDFWCFNEDAVCLHQVSVSDFEIGKYQVTMEQFYIFVNALAGDSEDDLYYMIGDRKYPVHQIAAIGLLEKKKAVRDNGWGLGDRPVINVSFNEMAEYCNWLSLKNALEPCYTITPVYNGGYGEGKSTVNVFRYSGNSCMQIKASRGESCQLVEIKCDIHKKGYRLPTEAEFEYVVRGGENISSIRGGKGYLYAGVEVESTDFNCDVSWQRKNTDNPQKSGSGSANLFNDNMGGNGYTSPVGTRIPNYAGIYDMTGNVWEVMNDIFNRSYFEECAEKGTVKDPTGPEYSIEQLSDMKNVNADRYLSGRYSYNYEKQSDGSMKRVSAVSIEASGKTHHVLRGGCHTNPFLFTSTLHRHAAGGISYVENFVNHFNARTGFRLARSL